jgi:predicted nucleic acid-binding protein
VANSFYLDASALAKRYVPETGSAQVDAILDAKPVRPIFVLNVCAGEVVSILVRKRNAGLLSAPDFGQAMATFKAEIIAAVRVTILPVTNRLARSSFPLIVAHSINSNDAVLLKSALTTARRLRAAGDGLVLVASDQRLLRAAQAEGLSTFNPESQDQAALAAFLGP